MKTCNKCGIPKRPEEFSAVAGMKKTACKVCLAAIARDWYWENRERARRRMKIYHDATYVRHPRKVIRPISPDGKILCTGCKQMTAIADMRPNRSTKSGLSTRCKVCARLKNRISYHKHKREL